MAEPEAPTMDVEKEPQDSKKSTPALIIIGMAGSGKTTLMQRLCAWSQQKKTPSYVLNLDPAVTKLPYGANIDIRDTVNYKEVMKQYGLGPNGGIMTSLNLFSTRFDQVLALCEKRAAEHEYILIDTPGQIEVFTWSASGTIITDLLASSFPTVLVFVIDTPRCVSPSTFMSNMLYVCSILYKTQLPLVVAFNKVDVVSHEFAVKWMRDFDVFQEALDAEADDSYMSSFTRSMCLVLEEFYENIKAVGVSAATGVGMEAFDKAVGEAVEEYRDQYLPELERRMREKKDEESRKVSDSLKQLSMDVETPPTTTAPEVETVHLEPPTGVFPPKMPE